MIRVSVVVEGQTEESFINHVLAPELWPREIFLNPIILGVPGKKGGRTNYDRVRKDILLHLKQDKAAYCSTMLDLYGLGAGFPGVPPPPNLSPAQNVTHLEQAMKADICAQIPDIRPDSRFIPYLQLHEYEALLFSDPAAFADALGQPNLAQRFQNVRVGFPTPEDIDDDPESAPSKRVIRIYPSYRKVLEGTIAAQRVGIARMRQECPHFREWMEQLETLAPARGGRQSP